MLKACALIGAVVLR